MLAILKDRALPVVDKNLLFHSPLSFFQRIKQIHRIHIREQFVEKLYFLCRQEARRLAVQVMRRDAASPTATWNVTKPESVWHRNPAKAPW